jgi:hypothetical protein
MESGGKGSFQAFKLHNRIRLVRGAFLITASLVRLE